MIYRNAISNRGILPFKKIKIKRLFSTISKRVVKLKNSKEHPSFFRANKISIRNI